MFVKRFTPGDIEYYKVERDNIREFLRAVKGPHSNIQLCFSAFKVGAGDKADGYIISFPAACDLAALLFGANRKQYDFEKDKGNPMELLVEFQGVVSALAWLHDGFETAKRGVLRCMHNDLKPENILVFEHDRKNEGKRWKITDFEHSFTRPMGPELESSQRGKTKIPSKIKPNDYTAPENEFQIDGGKLDTSSASDIWAFGCILLEVIAFIQGGRGATLELQGIRNREGSNNRFYQMDKTAENNTVCVKTGITEWLGKTLDDLEWGDVLQKVDVLKFLHVTPDERPRAKNARALMYTLLRNLCLKDKSFEYAWPPENTDSEMTQTVHPPEAPPQSITTVQRILRISSSPTSVVEISRFSGNIRKVSISSCGRWILYQQDSYACCLSLKALMDHHGPSSLEYEVISNVEISRKLVAQGCRVEASAVCGDFVVALFYPKDNDTKPKKVQCCS